MILSQRYMNTPKGDEEKKRLINRLKRVEGQVRGIQKMVDEDRYCMDVLIQIDAINAALKTVGTSLIEHHTSHCVIDRKSTRLNSSHVAISYAVFCLKTKNKYVGGFNEVQL